MTIDAERFLRDFCEIIGTPAVSVTVVCSPTPYDGNFPVDRLTGESPLETHIRVELAHGEPVESYGIDLAEALTEMMAGLELRRRPPEPVTAERHTVAGVDVSEADYLAAYPASHRDTVTDSGAFSPYTHSARGCVGEYTAHLLVNEGTTVPPLLYLYGAEGQEEYHLFPLVQMAPPH
ncbi:hypothetical protein LT337_32690 (plasmid) [Mycolicibacterium fortuitum]|nr:hypothetical protein LT337_32690 [Mycolicibacterium fortuitum]